MGIARIDTLVSLPWLWDIIILSRRKCFGKIFNMLMAFLDYFFIGVVFEIVLKMLFLFLNLTRLCVCACVYVCVCVCVRKSARYGVCYIKWEREIVSVSLSVVPNLFLGGDTHFENEKLATHLELQNHWKNYRMHVQTASS